MTGRHVAHVAVGSGTGMSRRFDGVVLLYEVIARVALMLNPCD